MPDEKKDGFESREIKYHSKSPEKLLEELKRKNEDRHSIYNKKRRIAFILIAISGLLIAGIALIFVVYRNQSVVEPAYIRNMNPLVFKIICESEYEYGHENEIKVRVSNIDNKEASFSFQDFSFSISSETEERIFGFNYPIKTEIQMAEFDSRDVYDFRRENPDFQIKPGTYTIDTNFTVNGQPVALTKQFVVFENIQTKISLYHDYIIPAQEVPIYLTIENNTPDDKNFALGSFNVYLEEKSPLAQQEVMEEIFRKSEEAPGEYQVVQGEKLDIVLGNMSFPSNTGNYQIKATYFLNDDLNEYQEDVMVNNLSRTDGVRRLRILPYTMKVVGVDQPYKAEILIVNDEDRDVYERVKGFIFEIIRDSTTLYRYTKYDDREINIFIPAYSKKNLFDSSQWRDIRFQESGKCEMKVRVILENGVLEYSEEIIIEK
ncbi:MAG: hypothetical protein ACLFQE_07385 [Thermotogota bacterium]